jgi:hypothetical protein
MPSRVEVIVRLRPARTQRTNRHARPAEPAPEPERDPTAEAASWQRGLVELTNDGVAFRYSVDRVLPPTASQADVFGAVGQDRCEELLNGCSATVLCNGAASAGKSWAMLGPKAAIPADRGLVARAMLHVLKSVLPARGERASTPSTKLSDPPEWVLRVRAVEILNQTDELRDLGRGQRKSSTWSAKGVSTSADAVTEHVISTKVSAPPPPLE